MTENNLTPEAKLEIRNEVESRLTKIAAFFGIANIVVVLAAIWLMWSSLSGQSEGITNSVRNEILEGLSTSKAELNEAVNEANRLIGRLQNSQSSLDQIETKISEMKDQIATFQNADQLEAASNFITRFEGTTDAKMLLEKLEDRTSIEVLGGCETPRIVTGQTDTKNTVWQRYRNGNFGAFVDINTSSAKFSKTPNYFLSLGGSGGHWSAVGAASVYKPSPTGFSSYVQWRDQVNVTEPIYEYATKNWYVSWVAIGC